MNVTYHLRNGDRFEFADVSRGDLSLIALFMTGEHPRLLVEALHNTGRCTYASGNVLIVADVTRIEVDL